MHNLPKTYTSKSITYNQINEGTILIYSCSGLGRKEWFEVYIPQLVQEFKIAGKIIEEHYRLPKDNDFGTIAWTYNTEEEANNKVRELLLERS